MGLSDRLLRRGTRYLHRLRIIDNPNEKITPWKGDLSTVEPSEKTKTPMHEAFYAGREMHKWRNYPDVYHRYFERFRGTNFRMLEIGVHKGGSLELWREYFGSKATIFGIDVNPECAKFNGVAGEVRIGSQDDPEFLQKVVAEMGGIDVVLDDGSHIADHQAMSFSVLFPLLNNGGVYLCEDTHTAYWRGLYGGGYKRRDNFIEVAKDLIDDIHTDFHSRGVVVMPNASRSIGGIHFYNSIVVIEKSEQKPPEHYQL